MIEFSIFCVESYWEFHNNLGYSDHKLNLFDSLNVFWSKFTQLLLYELSTKLVQCHPFQVQQINKF